MIARSINPGRMPGTGKIGQSLVLAGAVLLICSAIVAALFWNVLLPFYGLLYLWGAS